VSAKRGTTYRRAHTVHRNGKSFHRRGSKAAYWQGTGQRVKAAGVCVGLAGCAVVLDGIPAGSRKLMAFGLVGLAAAAVAFLAWNDRRRVKVASISQRCSRCGGRPGGSVWCRTCRPVSTRP
jgi:hypothetical protein